jgi:heptosyltransferase-2
MSSLVIQTSFIGDVILTTPLIALLSERGAVDVVTTPVGATVLRNHPGIRHLLVYDKRRTHSGVRGFVEFARETRRSVQQTSSHTPTNAYLAQGSMRSAALAMALGCKRRVGFSTSGGRALYTDRVTYRDDWHHAQRLLSLADYPYAEQLRPEQLHPKVYPGPDEVAAVDTLLNNRARPLIALAPGSVWATKRWPYFAQLATLIPEEFDIALIGGKEDAELAQEIAQDVDPGRIINAVGKLSLLGSAELIRRSRAIVTNDSSPQHLASAVGTPTVTVFGPTVREFGFGPLAPFSQSIGQDGLECRPCDRHGPQRCPLSHWKCMREMTAETVYTVLHSVMQISEMR